MEKELLAWALVEPPSRMGEEPNRCKKLKFGKVFRILHVTNLKN